MRGFKDLLVIDKYLPRIEDYYIGNTKILVYKNLDSLDEIYYSKRISLLFELVSYSDYELFWFNCIDEMYEDLDEYITLTDFDLKIIVIID